MFLKINTNKKNNEISKIYSYKNRNDLLLILFLFFILLLSFLLEVRGNYSYLPLWADVRVPDMCFFKNTTGHNCLSCGMTRSFISVSHLDFASAMRFNLAGIFAYALCVLQIVYRSVRVLTQNRSNLLKPLRYLINSIIIVGIVIVLINWAMSF